MPDLQPLCRVSELEEISFTDVSSVDIGALAGREGVTVRVDRAATVHEAERLGPGSRVMWRR